MSEAVKALWKHRTGGEALAVAITADGEYIVGGSGDGHVYFFRRDGGLLWRYKVAEGKVFRLALAAGAQRIAVGTTSGKYITLLDWDGQLVWQQCTQGNTWGAAVSGDGSLICGGSWDDCIYLWNDDGQLLWKYSTGDDIRRVAMTPDGEYIVAGSDDHHVYMLSRAGQLLWKHKTGGAVWAGARITPDGEYIVAGSNDEHVYLFDKTGQLLWRHKASENVNTVAITPDGQYIAAGSTDDHVYLLDQSGQLLWKYRTGNDVYGVALSADGQFVVAASYDHCAYLFNAEGEVLYKHETQNQAYGVAITPNGRYFAVGSRDHHIYLFENLLAPEKVAATGAAIIEPRRVIQRIRRAYIGNPYLGLGRWFEEFDRQVSRGHCEVCEELLQEARGQGYPFTPQEWTYVDSREGVLWLRRGITHHQNREYEQAQACYRRSLEIQKRVRHLASQGQVETAQGTLQSEQRTGQRDPFLETLAQELTVLGGSAALLCRRLDGSGVEECRQIIRAAVQLRLTQPLAVAAQSGAERVRMMAIAALGRFSQVDEDEVKALLAGVQDPHWFTRWRAAEALGQHSEDVKASVPSLSKALERETDPEVRRALALSLGGLGDRRATLALASAMGDADPEVRRAAALALAQVGDRRALAALRQVADGKGFLGESVGEAAQAAMQGIEKRHPLPKIRELHAYRLLSEEPVLQPAAVYWTDDPVHLVAAVSNAAPDTRLRLVCTDAAGAVVFEQEGRYAALQAELAPLRSRLQRASIRPTVSTRLVELVDVGPHESRADADTRFEVGMRVRCIKDGASVSKGLRVGDTGTVRNIGGRPSIGVEWDRDVGGHAGNLRFTCAKGHGWYVEKSEIEPVSADGASHKIASDSISFRVIPPAAAGWRPGQYVVVLQIYDGDTGTYEHSAEMAFGTIAQADIREAVICLQVDAANKPRHPTPVIVADTLSVYCTALLSEAPSGVEVAAELRGPGNRTVGRQAVKTEREGEQHLAFLWQKGRWEPGIYSVQLLAGKKNARKAGFRVVEGVVIQDAVACRAVDAFRRPLEPATIFLSNEETIYCSVALSEAPPLTQVVAQWLYLEQGRTLIRDCVATTDTPGEQSIAFSLSRPRDGWPLGRYEICIAALSPHESALYTASGQEATQTEWSIDKDRWHISSFFVQFNDDYNHASVIIRNAL